MQEKSESSETEEEITKVREVPWIHPDVVAGLIRSGEAEDRDRPALIRLYLRAQMNLFAKPGKSGKGKNYWPDNQTIADSLGVSKSDIQNALRDSDIERIDGGKGRGEDKRFRIVKKERNHGGKKDKGGKGKKGKGKKGKSKKGKSKKGQRGKRKTSIQRGQSDSENVESTSAPRNIDVCQQSNQRLQHVESTSATGGEGDGLEIKGLEGEGGGSFRARAREPKAPPPVVSQDSFKIRTAEDATEYLKTYDLLMAEGFSQGYYDVIAMVLGCYHRTVDDLDVTSAELLLKKFPSAYKRPEILANWIYWRACQLPAKWNKKTHFFTKIEETWEAFRSQAETILKDLKVIDEERRKVELRHQTEQAEAERIRQEAQDALQAVEDERLEQEEQARQLARHDAFVASLPAMDSIIAFIKAVPDLENFGYNEYLEWLNAMIDAVGLKLVLESSPYYYSYFKAAYRTVGFVPAEMITQTQQFIERVASGVLRGLRDSVAQCELIPRKVTWEMYCEHFGLNERNDRLCGCEIPKGALEYRKPIHNG